MKRRTYRFIFPLAAVFSLFALLSRSNVDYNHARISKVIDGDTVRLSNGKPVRYIGIDAPEIERKTEAGWREVHDPFSDDAKRANEELVLGKDVRLEFDVQKEDKFNRLLAYCFVKKGDSEVLVQVELLRQGLAYLYTFPPNIKYVDVLVAAQEEAKRNRVGLWLQDLQIDSKDASKFIGQRKMVSGFVKKTYSTAKTIRMSLDGLRVIIFKNQTGLFEKQGINPAEFYNGKKVEVFGLIKEYEGKPEIIISNPWQIEIVES